MSGDPNDRWPGDSWEARVSDRAKERMRLAADREAAELGEPTLAELRAEYLAERGEHVLSPETPPDGVDPEVCRECCTWQVISRLRFDPDRLTDVYGWMLTCQRLCGHEHHQREIWMAGARG